MLNAAQTQRRADGKAVLELELLWRFRIKVYGERTPFGWLHLARGGSLVSSVYRDEL